MAVRELSPARCTSASPLVLARRTKLFALSEMRWAALALGLFSAGLLTQLCGAPQWVRWALFLACYATGGWEPGLAGLQALQRRTLDVDLLMVVAAIGAAAIGQIAEGALLIVIFATSGALEALVTARTADSVRGLMGLAPGTATRVGAGGGEETVNAADLRIGDIVLVRPGERISADATVPALSTAPAPCGSGSTGSRGIPSSLALPPWLNRPARPRRAPSCSSRKSNNATRSAWSP